jgi:excisionase family DNA binding protein
MAERSQPITTGEASRILRVGEDTIRKWSDAGRLPAVRASSGARIFERRDVEQLAAQRATATMEKRAR